MPSRRFTRANIEAYIHLLEQYGEQYWEENGPDLEASDRAARDIAELSSDIRGALIEYLERYDGLEATNPEH